MKRMIVPLVLAFLATATVALGQTITMQFDAGLGSVVNLGSGNSSPNGDPLGSGIGGVYSGPYRVFLLKQWNRYRGELGQPNVYSI